VMALESAPVPILPAGASVRRDAVEGALLISRGRLIP